MEIPLDELDVEFRSIVLGKYSEEKERLAFK
jgi:hypothetical protein